MRKLHAWAWPAVALGIFLPAACLGWSPQPEMSPWALHPSRAWAAMPWWAAWTPAWVHASAAHLSGNLLATALIGLLGRVFKATPKDAAAWLLAWPVVHLGLMFEPRLSWYVGASGVLHAGAAIALVAAFKSHRTLASLMLAGLMFKLVWEALQGFPLVRREDIGISVAPLSHLIGTLTGLFFAGFHRIRFS